MAKQVNLFIFNIRKKKNILGSGKTYTMIGDIEGNQIKTPGLYLLASYDIFNILQRVKNNKNIL